MGVVNTLIGKYVDTNTGITYFYKGCGFLGEDGLNYYYLIRCSDLDVVVRSEKEFVEDFERVIDEDFNKYPRFSGVTNPNAVKTTEELKPISIGDKIFVDKIGECYVVDIKTDSITVIGNDDIFTLTLPVNYELIETNGLFNVIEIGNNISISVMNRSNSTEAKEKAMSITTLSIVLDNLNKVYEEYEKISKGIPISDLEYVLDSININITSTRDKVKQLLDQLSENK